MRELCVFHYRWGFSEIVQPNVAHCKHRYLVVPNPAIEIFTGFCMIQKTEYEADSSLSRGAAPVECGMKVGD